MDMDFGWFGRPRFLTALMLQNFVMVKQLWRWISTIGLAKKLEVEKT